MILIDNKRPGLENPGCLLSIDANHLSIIHHPVLPVEYQGIDHQFLPAVNTDYWRFFTLEIIN